MTAGAETGAAPDWAKRTHLNLTLDKSQVRAIESLQRSRKCTKAIVMDEIIQQVINEHPDLVSSVQLGTASKPLRPQRRLPTGQAARVSVRIMWLHRQVIEIAAAVEGLEVSSFMRVEVDRFFRSGRRPADVREASNELSESSRGALRRARARKARRSRPAHGARQGARAA